MSERRKLPVLRKDVGTRSQAWLLEGKASVGPCLRISNEQPSGIMICIPKKSLGNVKENLHVIASIININTKKSAHVNSHFYTDFIKRSEKINIQANETNDVQKIDNIPKLKVFPLMKQKIDALRMKLRNAWNT